MNKKRHGLKGQVAVLFTLALPVLIGVTGLGCDVAVMYFNWVSLQKAADAAVLAGANSLPGDPSGAITAAANYVQSNGVSSSEIAATSVAADDMSITISLARTVPYFFGRVLGLTSQIIRVQAKAGLQAVTKTTSNLVPIGLPCTAATMPCYTAGETLTLKYGQVGSGNWTPLQLGQAGAATYSANVLNGYDGSVSIGDQVYPETGDMTGPTRSAINQRISEGQASDPGGSASSFTPGDARVIEIPVVDFSAVGGKSTSVPVLGFATVWVSGLDSQAGLTGVYLSAAASGIPDPGKPTTGSALTPVLLQ